MIPKELIVREALKDLDDYIFFVAGQLQNIELFFKYTVLHSTVLVIKYLKDQSSLRNSFSVLLMDAQ
jgi:hypothetical protein